MSAKGDKITYKARIKPETVDALASMAAALGFVVTTPGRYHGQPSTGDLLDALAARYTAVPTAVTAVLRDAGITPDD